MLKLGPKTAEELSGNVKAKPNVKVAEPERKKESSSSNIAQNAAQTNGNTVASGVPPNDSGNYLYLKNMSFATIANCVIKFFPCRRWR